MAVKTESTSAANGVDAKEALDSGWDLDSSWDDDPPAAISAPKSIPPTTDAVDTDWADEPAAPAPVAAPPVLAAPSVPDKPKPSVERRSPDPATEAVTPRPSALSARTPASTVGVGVGVGVDTDSRSPARSTAPLPPSERGPKRGSVAPASLRVATPSPKSVRPIASLTDRPRAPSPPEAPTTTVEFAATPRMTSAANPSPASSEVSISVSSDSASLGAHAESASEVTSSSAAPLARSAANAAAEVALEKPTLGAETNSLPAWLTPSSPPTENAFQSGPPMGPALWDATATPDSSSDSHTLRPSNVEVAPPPSVRARRGRWQAPLAAAAAVAIGLSAWTVARQSKVARQHAATQAQAAVTRPQAEPARAAPVAQAQAPAAEAARAEQPASSAAPPNGAEPPTAAGAAKPAEGAPAPQPQPQLAAAFAAALSASPNSIQVTVHVTPAGAIVFDHGKRVGNDTVQVNVEPGSTKNLVALLDGYLPRKFTLDGSVNQVNIALKPALNGEAPLSAKPTPAAEQAAAAPGAAPKPALSRPAAKSSNKPFDPSADVGSL